MEEEPAMFKLVNKHEEFFDYLVSNAETFHRGAVMAKEVLQDVSKLDAHNKEGIQLEKDADKVTREIVRKMKKVFITPIDREDFYSLTCNLDDCVDDIKDVLMSLQLYHAGIGGELPLRMADILVQMSSEMISLFHLLKDIDRNEGDIAERALKINRLESEADAVYRQFVFDLFDGTHDVMEIIRWKEIIEALETTADQAEKVGNIIKEVVMKYA